MARRRGQKLGELMNKSGWWLLRYYVDTPEVDETGKPIRDRITIPLARSKGEDAIGKREANRKRIAYMQSIDQFAVRPSSMKTLESFVKERFEPDVMANLKKGGRQHYEYLLNPHILPVLGSVSLRDITSARLQAFLAGKLKAGLSVQTVTHLRNCLSAILRHAKAMQCFAGELPTDMVRLPEMKRKARRALTWEQVCAIANKLEEPASTLVVFLTLTGLRIGEAMGLRWKWVNLTAETRIVNGELIPGRAIAVRENFTRGQYESLKTGSSLGNIPLPEWFIPRMWELLSRTQWIGPNDPVFAAANGQPLNRDNLARRELKPAAIAAGVGDWVSYHTFRYTNTTLADQGGLTITERRRILRHAGDAMTDRYSRADLDRVRPLIEGMVDPAMLRAKESDEPQKLLM